MKNTNMWKQIIDKRNFIKYNYQTSFWANPNYLIPEKPLVLAFGTNGGKTITTIVHLEQIFQNIPNEKDPLNKMLYLESKFFLVDHNLNYSDKMSMYNSVETRVPYLDVRVVDFAASLPVDLKFKNGQAKYILKKVADKYLDKDIIYRKKTGFGAPLRQWILNDFQHLFDRYLNKDILRKQGVFDHDAVWKLSLIHI